MITGFNTDVERDGKVFHVQTEDKGLDNPVVETLIYCGGEILTSRRSSYEELLRAGGLSEEEILGRMESQHEGLIREIRQGKFDTDAPLPFGHKLISNRSLDEVVQEFLAEHGDPEPISLKTLDWQVLQEGTRPTLRLRVQSEASSAPVVDASVSIQLIDADQPPRELFSAATDADGFVEACFEIPEAVAAGAELLCEAVVGRSRAELRKKVKRTRRRRGSASST